MPDTKIKELKAPKSKTDPAAVGMHDKEVEGEDTGKADDEMSEPNEITPAEDEHAKDQPHKTVNKVELVGSVSEMATLLLNEELPKLTNMPLDKRVVVISKKSDSKQLIPLVSKGDRDFGVFHNKDNHLPLFNRSIESWLDSNNIPHSDDMGTLLRMLGGE